jgi:hypothetical protein
VVLLVERGVDVGTFGFTACRIASRQRSSGRESAVDMAPAGSRSPCGVAELRDPDRVDVIPLEHAAQALLGVGRIRRLAQETVTG